jgi:hypothetical protein
MKWAPAVYEERDHTALPSKSIPSFNVLQESFCYVSHELHPKSAAGSNTAEA